MQRKLFLVFFQCVLFFNKYKFTYSKPFIGNGIRVPEENEFPFVVCIRQACQMDDLYVEASRCSGTLVTRSHVVTSAHCFDILSELINIVVFGSVDVRNGTRVNVMWWISYDQWAVKNRIRIEYDNNDINVAKIIESVPDNIPVARLCPISATRLVGMMATAVGCGFGEPEDFPTNIEAMELQIIPNSICYSRAMQIRQNVSPVPQKDLCTMRQPFGLLSNGDSGGPLLYENFLVGINRGVYPGLRGHYHEGQSNYHCSIEFYRTFIESTMGD